jgi:uncharacterized membrane protein
MLGIVLLAFAFVFAVLAAVSWPPQARIHLGWTAIVFFLASLLFSSVVRLVG